MSATDRPIITRIGLASPLALGADATWRAILAGGVTRDLGRVPVGPDTSRSRVEQLAFLALDEAHPEPIEQGTALVVGTSKGNVEAWMEGTSAHPIGLHDLANAIARERRIDGPRFTLSAACASGLHAIGRAVMMLERGEARRAIVIGAESSLGVMFTSTFRRLGALARPGEAARPFDETRDGFVMSEAAACAVIEMRSPYSGGIAIGRRGLAGDAYHLTGMDPEAKSLRRLLSDVAGDRPFDLAHAHATGTASDAIELAAIEQTITGTPTVYSHKAALGHSLGAAGVASVVLSVLMHRHGIVPGNVETGRPIRSTLAISQRPVQRTISRSVCIASGFGGSIGVVELETVQ
ncbi:MAG: beta-ketoacyl synthase N-terminal-like domain-containing protein [Tepidisphaeraceae bacterium]